MGRWIAEEEAALKALKIKLRDQLLSAPQFPELVGDRRLIRFLRGRDNDVNLAAGMFIDHLKWRKDNNVDHVRKQICYHGINHPFLFPKGELMIKLCPQIVIAPNARDYLKQPMVFEFMAFNVKEAFEHITIEDYVEFFIYALEYRSMILEQLSDEIEREYLRDTPDSSKRIDGYGVILKICIIRDLKNLGISHLGPKAQAIIKKALQIATPNYQEMLGKNHMINTPWVFNALWGLMKSQGWLEPSTIAKIALYGSDYMSSLKAEIPLSSIPKAVGGQLEAYNETFEFDVGEGGCLYWPQGPKVPPSKRLLEALALAQAAVQDKVHEAANALTLNASKTAGNSTANMNGSRTTASNYKSQHDNPAIAALEDSDCSSVDAIRFQDIRKPGSPTPSTVTSSSMNGIIMNLNRKFSRSKLSDKQSETNSVKSDSIRNNKVITGILGSLKAVKKSIKKRLGSNASGKDSDEDNNSTSDSNRDSSSLSNFDLHPRPSFYNKYGPAAVSHSNGSASNRVLISNIFHAAAVAKEESNGKKADTSNYNSHNNSNQNILQQPPINYVVNGASSENNNGKGKSIVRLSGFFQRIYSSNSVINEGNQSGDKDEKQSWRQYWMAEVVSTFKRFPTLSIFTVMAIIFLFLNTKLLYFFVIPLITHKLLTSIIDH